MNEKLYQLEHNLDHLVDENYDAELVKNVLTKSIFGFTLTKELNFDFSIYFQANFKTLENTDFPFCNVSWPIISKKMLSVLLEIKPFPHQAIPVTMLDDSKPFKKCFDENNEPYPNLCNNNFVALQLLEHTDAFDWEKSVYKKHPRREDKVVQITKGC